MLDPIEVALEAQPVRVGDLGTPASSRTDGTSGPRREQRIERGLALLPLDNTATDERVRALVRAPNRRFEQFSFPCVSLSGTHGTMKSRPCDGYAVEPGPPVPSAAWPAARRAIGTRYGEHDT